MAQTTYPRIPVVSLASSVFVAFGVSLYAVSVLITDEAAGGVFSTSVLSAAYGGAAIIAGLLAPHVGRYADDHSVTAMAVLGAALGAGAMAVFAVATVPIVVLGAFWLLLGPATAMTLYEPAFIAVNQWVDAPHRNRAIAVLTVIGGLAGPVFLPMTGALVDGVGWRTTAWILAALYLSTAAVAMVFYPRHHPIEHRQSPPERAPWSRFLTDRRLLFISVSMILSYAAMNAILFHRVALFEEDGYVVATVALLAGISGLMTFPGRYLMPHSTAWLRPTRAVTVACVGLVGSIVLALIGTPFAVMVAFFLVFGFFFGFLIPTRPVIMTNWYAGEDFGSVTGKQWAMAALVGGLAPWLVGVGKDAFGSYTVPIAIIGAVIGVAAIANMVAEHLDTS